MQMRLKGLGMNIAVILALFVGIAFGAWAPKGLSGPVAQAAGFFIKILVKLVPYIIAATVTAAISNLIKQGRAGRFAGNVILWYVGTSALAAFYGMAFAVLYLRLPLDVSVLGNPVKLVGELFVMMKAGLTLPWMIALYVAVAFGIIGAYVEPIYKVFSRTLELVEEFGRYIALLLVPIVFAFGTSLSLKVGPKLGLQYYGLITLLTGILCLAWQVAYLYFLQWLTGERTRSIASRYWLPVGLWAWSTASSYSTLPVNLYKAREYGVRKEVRDFIIPLGATVNMDGGALGNLFVVLIVFAMFGIHFDATFPLLIYPALVIFSIATAGIPAVGPGLYIATVVSTMLGVPEPTKTTLITTALALVSGLPDSFRTLVNATDDGFMAIGFNRLWDAYFASPEQRTTSLEEMRRIHAKMDSLRKGCLIATGVSLFLVLVGLGVSARLAVVALYLLAGSLACLMIFAGFVKPADLRGKA